jgi:hypothetical protein
MEIQTHRSKLFSKMFTVSVRGGICDYWPRATKTATPLHKTNYALQQMLPS